MQPVDRVVSEDNHAPPADEAIDWEKVGPVPAGDYIGELAQADYGVDRNNRHKLVAQFKILRAQNPANAGYIDRILFDDWSFTQQAAFRVKNFAGVANIALPILISEKELRGWIPLILGTKVGIRVRNREHEGRMRDDITRYLPTAVVEAGPVVPEVVSIPVHAESNASEQSETVVPVEELSVHEQSETVVAEVSMTRPSREVLDVGSLSNDIILSVNNQLVRLTLAETDWFITRLNKERKRIKRDRDR